MFTKLGRQPPHLSISRWRFVVAWAVLTAPLAFAQTPVDAAGPLTLNSAVALALSHNPGLAALEAQADALKVMPSQAGALPDAMLSLNAMNLPTDTFSLDQEPMTQLQIGVSQSFPFPGKRKLRRAAAEDEAQAGDARTAEQRSALQGAVRSAWWQVFALDRALEIVEQNKTLMRNFVKIAETKYSVGQGLQQDVLLAQLELSRLLDREAQLAGRRRGAQANLNALLDRPPNVAVILAGTPPNVVLPELPPEGELLNQGLRTRDLLNVHRELLEAADRRLALAKRDTYPDFRLGAGYAFRQGRDALRGDRADFFSVMLSVNLPLYAGSKQNKAIDQRRHERTQRQYALEGVLRSIQAEIARHLAEYDAARAQVSILDTAIIPQARQTVASMLAGYQVNKVDFLNVVNGQLTLYNAQINYWEALSKAKRSLAGVAAAVGTEALYE